MDDFEYEVAGIEYTSNYKPFEPHNPLNRPPIRYQKFVISIVVFLLLIPATYFLSGWCAQQFLPEHTTVISAVSTIIVELIYLIIISKKAVIWCVKVYQHYAPDHIRLRCSFEPSCSEYMILAVKKYGTFKGVAKGINRLLRCHPPGGIDYP